MILWFGLNFSSMSGQPELIDDNHISYSTIIICMFKDKKSHT